MAAVAALLTLAACSSEDAPEVKFHHPGDSFMPAADDQSEEAQLRRQFFEETGSYLIFNDTLQHEFLGNDINGDPRYFTELVDLLYSVGQTATSVSSYTYTYLSTIEQKKKMVQFLKDYVLPHLSDRAKPFSWFVSDVITGKNNMGEVMKPYALTNQRCVAIAANYMVLRERTASQSLAYAQRVLNAMASQIATNHEDEFADFYALSSDYYGRMYSSMGYDSTIGQAQLYELGFLAKSSVLTFPSTAQDLSAYSSAVIQYSDAELQSRYGKYELVMKKLAIMKAKLQDLGYKF